MSDGVGGIGFTYSYSKVSEHCCVMRAAVGVFFVRFPCNAQHLQACIQLLSGRRGGIMQNAYRLVIK